MNVTADPARHVLAALGAVSIALSLFATSFIPAPQMQFALSMLA